MAYRMKAVLLCLIFVSISCGTLFSQDTFETFTHENACYTIKIPAGITDKSADPNRMLWNYYPSPSSSPLAIRVNHVFVGLSVDHGEYMNILEETKKNEGMEVRTVDIKNGKGFVYESKTRKSDDEQEALYLIALSEKGWICTVTVSGKGNVLKKEMAVARAVVDSFEFLGDRKGKK